MRAIVACLIIAALGFTAEASVNQLPMKMKSIVCPPPSPHGPTLVPNPADCGSYYDCSNGIPTLMPCYPGLHFNRFEMVCDHPTTACCDPKYDPENKCP